MYLPVALGKRCSLHSRLGCTGSRSLLFQSPSCIRCESERWGDASQEDERDDGCRQRGEAALSIDTGVVEIIIVVVVTNERGRKEKDEMYCS